MDKTVVSANVTLDQKKKLQELIDSGRAANMSHAFRIVIDAYGAKPK
jgi:hypothetical protein